MNFMTEDIVYTIGGLIALGLLSVNLIFRYSSKLVSRATFWVSAAVWISSFSYFVILPADIYLSNRATVGSDAKRHMVTFWRFFYWGAFAVTALLLPILRNYEISGYFTFPMKIKDSLKIFALWYLFYGVVGILGIYYLFKSGMVSNL